MEVMETLLNTAIREVIDTYPEAGAILEEHGVGCVTCQVGTCLLKDIVAIHDLSPEDEVAVMTGIAGIVAPGAAGVGQAITVASGDRGAAPGGAAPIPAGPAATAASPIKYSPPIRQLVEEHRLIKRWVAQIPDVIGAVDLKDPGHRQLVLDGIDFIRSYADKFHHAKEEGILFGYFERESPAITAFRAEHDVARAHTRQAEEAVEGRDCEAVAEHLTAYGRLLTSHIKREDEVLYPWMDRELSTAQIGELHSRFAAVDATVGKQFTPYYTQLVDRIEAWATGTLEWEAHDLQLTTQKVEAIR